METESAVSLRLLRHEWARRRRAARVRRRAGREASRSALVRPAAGTFLVHEVPRARRAARLAIAFHGSRTSLTSCPATGGDGSRIPHAGRRWVPRRQRLDEVVATAFGNGLAGERFDPRSVRSDRSTTSLDRRARHRAVRALAGRLDVRLGPELAEELVSLAEGRWPDDRRPAGRYFWYVTVFAEDASSSATRSRGRVPSVSRIAPSTTRCRAATPGCLLGAEGGAGDRGQLAARPALAARAGVPGGSWEAVLAEGTRPSTDTRSDGTLVFTLVARPPRRSGADAACAPPSMVQPAGPHFRHPRAMMEDDDGRWSDGRPRAGGASMIAAPDRRRDDREVRAQSPSPFVPSSCTTSASSRWSPA